jgi:hypothetical protein
MIVLKSKYLEMENKWLTSALALQHLTRKWNDLVDRINKLGGENFLRKTQTPAASASVSVSNPFSEAEIQSLIRLCHPDKHGNSAISNEMTALLLSVRSTRLVSK